MITLLMGRDGETLEVNADVYGALAVHFYDNDDTSFAVGVSHVKSGCGLGTFGDWKDASAFAEQANQMMNFDAYAQSIIDIGIPETRLLYKESIQSVRQLRATFDSYEGCNSGYATETPPKLIKKHMKTMMSKQP